MVTKAEFFKLMTLKTRILCCIKKNIKNTIKNKTHFKKFKIINEKLLKVKFNNK